MLTYDTYCVHTFAETYYVSTRTKSLPPDSQDAINEILKKNEVEQDWADVEQVCEVFVSIE